MKVSFGLVNFHSPLIERLERDLLPTIAHYPQGEFEIICVDNDPLPGRELLEFLSQVKTPVRYLWNGGANQKVAAAKNQIYTNAKYPIVVYLCANHGRMIDPTWLEDLIQPLKDPQIAMAGNFGRYFLAEVGAGSGVGTFVQGAVIAVQTKVLRKHPMSDRFPHAHSDKWISRHLVENGYKLANVRTVLSVWKRAPRREDGFKYIHAD